MKKMIHYYLTSTQKLAASPAQSSIEYPS